MTGNRSDDATRPDEGNVDLRFVHGGSCLQRAHREMLETTLILGSLGTVIGAILIYSITGPLSIEDTLPVGGRLLYIGLCGLICWPLCHSLSTTILYVMRRRKPHEIVLAAIAGAAFLALPCSAVAYTVFGIAGKSYAGGFADIYLSLLLAVGACSTVVHYTACLRARLRAAAEDGTSAERLTHRAACSAETAGSSAPISATQAAGEKPSRFLDRLPENLGHDVIYLNVSGHYVNAVTTQGSGVVLMRFADAIAELDDVGIQVHRSYWAAYRHITAISRREERTLVCVTGDRELPVSRTYLTGVRALIPHVGKGQQTGSPPGSSTTDSPHEPDSSIVETESRALPPRMPIAPDPRTAH